MEFTYQVRLNNEQIMLADRLINRHLQENPAATVDDALDYIFQVGCQVINAAELDAVMANRITPYDGERP